MNTRTTPFPSAPLGTGEAYRAPRFIRPVISFARWYWRTARQMAVFALGYTIGGIVVAILIECPPILRALVGS